MDEISALKLPDQPAEPLDELSETFKRLAAALEAQEPVTAEDDTTFSAYDPANGTVTTWGYPPGSNSFWAGITTATPHRYTMTAEEGYLWQLFVFDLWAQSDHPTKAKFEAFKLLLMKRRLAGDLSAEAAGDYLKVANSRLGDARQQRLKRRPIPTGPNPTRSQGHAWADANPNIKLNRRDPYGRR